MSRRHTPAGTKRKREVCVRVRMCRTRPASVKDGRGSVLISGIDVLGEVLGLLQGDELAYARVVAALARLDERVGVGHDVADLALLLAEAGALLGLEGRRRERLAQDPLCVDRDGRGVLRGGLCVEVGRRRLGQLGAAVAAGVAGIHGVGEVAPAQRQEVEGAGIGRSRRRCARARSCRRWSAPRARALGRRQHVELSLDGAPLRDQR